MRVVETFEATRALSEGRTGLVPTMGFLHEGHLSLIEAARDANETVVVSVFVNPLQFGEPDDLASYPRDLDRDVSLAAEAGADVVFAPDESYMYPVRPKTSVSVAGVADDMEGAHRPGHFDGVATVVAKLLSGVQPNAAYFGRKDAQQLAVISTLVDDLSLPVHIVGLPIVRESDGLALSSRNVRLSPAERARALVLSRSLFEAAGSFEAGESKAGALTGAVRAAIAASGDIEPEYVELARARDAAIVDEAVEGEYFLAVAARVGATRLIDNITLDADHGSADRGIHLTGPSMLYEEG